MLCKCCWGCLEPRCSSRSMKIHWGSHCSSLRASLFSRLNGIPALLNLLLFQKQYCAIHNMPRLCLQRREKKKKKTDTAYQKVKLRRRRRTTFNNTIITYLKVLCGILCVLPCFSQFFFGRRCIFWGLNEVRRNFAKKFSRKKLFSVKTRITFNFEACTSSEPRDAASQSSFS